VVRQYLFLLDSYAKSWFRFHRIVVIYRFTTDEAMSMTAEFGGGRGGGGGLQKVLLSTEEAMNVSSSSK
jgi:hypothetical protein